MEPIVYIVDDDRAMTDSLRVLIESTGQAVDTFNSAQDFLAAYDPAQPGCILIDERMPGMGGHALQQELVRRRALSPVIIITGHAEVESTVDAMRLGAVTLIQKPFHDQQLLDAIHEALEKDATVRRQSSDRRILESRFEKLTPRQEQVLEFVISGTPNRTIALKLAISERTVELHRSRLLQTMGVGSTAELAFAVGRLRSKD